MLFALANAFCCTCDTFLPNVTLVRLLQPLKACCPMVVTPSGTTMSVRAEQFMKAVTLMHVTELGMVTLVRAVQSSNSERLMSVSASGSVTSVSAEHCANAWLPICASEWGRGMSMWYSTLMLNYSSSH